jgi:HAD superfamily hydrolase (TIGR01549 family)
MADRYPIFDLDGTLVDSDAALLATFVALGVDPDVVSFGHVLAVECDRLGIDVDAYLEAYDTTAAQPFAGIEAMLAQLDVWSVCSNKHPSGGRAELARLGWLPQIALFSDAFAGAKELVPILDQLGVDASEVVFVGDTEHDRACAAAVGATFLLAGWNHRARPERGDIDLDDPLELLDHLG